MAMVSKRNKPWIEWMVFSIASMFLMGGVDAQETPAAASPSQKESVAEKTGQENKAGEDTAPKGESQAVAPSETKSVEESKSTSTERPRKTSSKEKVNAKKEIRQLALSGTYSDLQTPPSLNPADLLLGGASGKSKSFFKLCDYLDEMGEEEKLVYVLFDLSDPDLDFNSAQLDELTRRLGILKTKGKKTIAWLENASNVHLAIASCCDEILMADFGGIDMPSSSMETMFYKDAMDLLGIKASVVRAGDFKGAVEPYLNPVMSDHLRSHYLAMLESINAAQVTRIAKGRGLTSAAVRELQKKRMLLPNEALAAGLVTKLAPYGAMKKTITEMIGSEFEWTKPKSKPKRELSLFEIMGKAMAGPKESVSKIKEDSIVVLHMQGAIEDGKEESPGAIVSGPMVKTIEELSGDEKVKGVVVRVNSPGGSATASEAIRQALLELAKKKPVVFSMGEVAASGGYWVTCIGQPIYAEQGTVTGSIGVFSLKISAGSLFRRVGVHVESITLDAAAGADAINRTWSDEEISNMQRFIDDVYSKFLSYASDSRKLPVDKLQSLAGGRVWSGEQAKHAGLVDEIGGVDNCLTVVAKRANLSKYKVIHRPESSSSLDLFKMFDDGDEDEVLFASFKALEPTIMNYWLKKGFRLDSLRAILRNANQSNQGMPRVWAMMPDEFRVR